MWKTFWKVFHLSTMIRQVLCTIARMVFFNPIMPAIARSQADIRQADIRNPLRYVALHQITARSLSGGSLLLIQASPHTLLIAFRNPAGDLLDLVKPCLLTYSPFFVKVKALKQRVDFSVPTFFATQSAPFRRDRLCGFYCVKKARSVSHT